MITEIAIIFPISVLWYFNILKWWIVCCCIGIIYWMPKCIIRLAKIIFPNVLFSKNVSESLTFDRLIEKMFSNKEFTSLYDREVYLTFDDVSPIYNYSSFLLTLNCRCHMTRIPIRK